MNTKYNVTYTSSSNINPQTQNICGGSVEKFSFSSSGPQNDIYSLAKAFLYIAPMTNKKLQKMCYYAKAWYLALYDENLISEQFQAWVHGAVQPALYQRYKSYGFDYIPKNENISGVPEHFIAFAQEIYDSYGSFSGDQLERLNHQELPWINARGECNPWENCSNEISEDDMKAYYRKQLEI